MKGCISSSIVLLEGLCLGFVRELIVDVKTARVRTRKVNDILVGGHTRAGVKCAGIKSVPRPLLLIC